MLHKSINDEYILPAVAQFTRTLNCINREMVIAAMLFSLESFLISLSIPREMDKITL